MTIIKNSILVAMISSLGFTSEVAMCQSSVNSSPKSSINGTIQRELGWERTYSISFAPNHGTRLQGWGRLWTDLTPIKVQQPNDSDYGWVEYFPQQGQPIWCVLKEGNFIISGTSDHVDQNRLAQIHENPDAFPRDGSFSIPADLDGRGYRIWNRDRTQMVGEQFFQDEGFSSLQIKLEPSGGDSFIVHVDHLNVLDGKISVQYSLDGNAWSNHLVIRNHEKPISWDKRLSPHFPSGVLQQNPHPWVEVDVFINLVHLRRRFRFGTKEEPMVNPPPRHGHEPMAQDLFHRARQWQETQDREKAAATAEGRAWIPKPLPATEPELGWATK